MMGKRGRFKNTALGSRSCLTAGEEDGVASRTRRDVFLHSSCSFKEWM